MTQDTHPWQRHLLMALHIAVLGGCGLLLVLISADVLKGQNFLLDAGYRRSQTWVCLLFQLDIIVEICVTPRKWRYVFKHALFIIIAIPWTSLLGMWHLGLDAKKIHIIYLLQYIPLLRVAYVVYMISGAMEGNKVSGMFAGYMSLLVAVTYISSLIFFLEEKAVNGLVSTYWDSLYWSYMNLTTTGCSIPAFTTTGKILNIVLPGTGLILFPVFTVYVTRRLQRVLAVKDAKLTKAEAVASHAATAVATAPKDSRPLAPTEKKS